MYVSVHTYATKVYECERKWVFHGFWAFWRDFRRICTVTKTETDDFCGLWYLNTFWHFLDTFQKPNIISVCPSNINRDFCLFVLLIKPCMLVCLDSVYTLEIITRTLREVVNRERLCGVALFYWSGRWGRLETRPPVARESSPELFAYYVASSSGPPLPFTDEPRLGSDVVQSEAFRPIVCAGSLRRASWGKKYSPFVGDSWALNHPMPIHQSKANTYCTINKLTRRIRTSGQKN